MNISDHSLAPLEPDNDPELVKWARYGVAQVRASGPSSFADVIGCLRNVAERFDRGEATRQELQDALMQLEGAKRVVGEALVQAGQGE
ncbi:MAG TPA: hypothetical protein VN612_04340 [Acidobacteriaceae bacterium]|nr:hypothetical protein [Acidobacteriaceae bacterium]